ncbi:MAG: aminopeptidase, partial [Alistipes sp.]|nr:aminopeptidase [Alistipes sp.]
MKKFLTLVVAIGCTMAAVAQQAEKAEEKKGYQFTDVKVLETTPVKNQNRSGTCWCFSTLSFLENEIIKEGGKAVHLSEMYVVRLSYLDKAERYVRMHGSLNFAEGGAAHDVTDVIKKHGIVPFEVYQGLNYGTDLPDFHELTAVMKAYLDAVIRAGESSRRALSTAWKRGFNAILDEYFGQLPETFTWEGKEYTPASYAASLPIEMDNYIDISSFTHHPFYETFVLEVPDNWMGGEVYNLPLEEMMRVVDHALEQGYSLAWGTDVSEKGFSRTKAIGVVPEMDPKSMSGTEAERWG